MRSVSARSFGHVGLWVHTPEFEHGSAALVKPSAPQITPPVAAYFEVVSYFWLISSNLYFMVVGVREFASETSKFNGMSLGYLN